MSDPKAGAFDIVIRYLKMGAKFEAFYGDEAKASVNAAIRFLEAAAKVTSEDIKQHLAGYMNEPVAALLAALPDGHPQSGEPKEGK